MPSCNALGYDDAGLTGNGSIRPHDRPHPMDKVKLAPLYIPGRGIAGSSKDLLPVYDILQCFSGMFSYPRWAIKMRFMVTLLIYLLL